MQASPVSIHRLYAALWVACVLSIGIGISAVVGYSPKTPYGAFILFCTIMLGLMTAALTHFWHMHASRHPLLTVNGSGLLPEHVELVRSDIAALDTRVTALSAGFTSGIASLAAQIRQLAEMRTMETLPRGTSLPTLPPPPPGEGEEGKAASDDEV